MRPDLPLAATSSQPPASSGRKRVRKERMSLFEERMLGALEAQTPAAAPLSPPQAEDEDELFF